MKILVLGASGMAGHVVSLFLKEKGHLVDTLSGKTALDEDTHLIDATNTEKLTELLKKNQYHALVNCAGLLVKQSEERKDLAVSINSYIPRFLENHYKNLETKIIHISTDGVFSGENPPYKETSDYDGVSFYGRTKALGEIINPKDLTFRMSIVGPDLKKEGAGLFNWFYQQHGEIDGYTNITWSGITTLELAKAIEAAINQSLTGLYHLVPNESISKFALLQLFREVYGHKDIKISPIEGKRLDFTLINTRKDFDYKIPDYKTMLYDMKKWIESHSGLYKHYEK
jgi:dTDP-4-dehydrorhamnose reductase